MLQSLCALQVLNINSQYQFRENEMFYFTVYPSACFLAQNINPYSYIIPNSQSQVAAQSYFKNDLIPQAANPNPQNPQQITLTIQDLLAAGYQSNKKIWTEEEDKLLLYLRNKKKMDWIQISKKIPQRNKKMCYSRYKRLTSSTKNHWLKKHDQNLISYVNEMGQNWVEIAKLFKNRNARQVKDRYQNFLRPGINQCEWTLQDDVKLINLLNQHGKNWKRIEEGLEGRTQNQIKNRFYGRIKKLNDKKLGKSQQHPDSSE